MTEANILSVMLIFNERTKCLKTVLQKLNPNTIIYINNDELRTGGKIASSGDLLFIRTEKFTWIGSIYIKEFMVNKNLQVRTVQRTYHNIKNTQ